jgi:hypothetical protein
MRNNLLGYLMVGSLVVVGCVPAADKAGSAGAAGANLAGSAGAGIAGASGGGGGDVAGQAGSAGAGQAGAAGDGSSGEAGASGAAGEGGSGQSGEGGAAGKGGTGQSGEGGAAGKGGTGQSGEGGAAGEGGSGQSTVGGAAGAGQAGVGGAAGAGGGAGAGSLGWTKLISPCGGNKINALWFDDESKGFAGCGELAAGKGLQSTADGGKSWVSHPKFNEVRVVDVRRGTDGVLYGAGTHTVEGFSAWSVDESAPANLKVIGLYTPSNQAFVSVPIGENIARTDDGKLLVDSLTGGSAAFRAPGGAFTEHYSLDEALIDDPEALIDFAPRKIISLGNDFYATGNKINEPARIFLPTKKAGGGGVSYFQRVELQASNLDGEPYDMHAWSPTSMIVAGWDRSYNYPLIFVSEGDPYEKSSWKQIDLLDSGITWQGGAYGLSVSGDTVVLVGQKLPGDFGFVIESKDRGKTWSEITPEGKPEVLWRARLFPGGRLLAAGGGELWVREPM